MVISTSSGMFIHGIGKHMLMEWDRPPISLFPLLTNCLVPSHLSGSRANLPNRYLGLLFTQVIWLGLHQWRLPHCLQCQLDSTHFFPWPPCHSLVSHPWFQRASVGMGREIQHSQVCTVYRCNQARSREAQKILQKIWWEACLYPCAQ